MQSPPTACNRCGSTTAVRIYQPGPRCPDHTPAALAGRPEPGEGAYCPPAICWCGECPWATPPVHSTTEP